jgi:hypothetical protein
LAKYAQKLRMKFLKKKGFYLWGNYDSRKFWQNIYLGKAGFGKTANLRSRILEELKDERCCFWRIKYSEDDLQKLRETYYSKNYQKEWKRSLLKANTTHIVFVASPEINEGDVEIVESDLIESMNPIANIKRPVPPAFLNSDTAKIFHQLREQIHNERKNRFIVSLKESQHTSHKTG